MSVVGPWTKLEDFKNAAMGKFVQDTKRFKWAENIALEDWAPALIKHISYDAQLLFASYSIGSENTTKNSTTK